MKSTKIGNAFHVEHGSYRDVSEPPRHDIDINHHTDPKHLPFLCAGGQVHVSSDGGDGAAGDTVAQAAADLQVQGLRPQGFQEAQGTLRH